MTVKLGNQKGFTLIELAVVLVIASGTVLMISQFVKTFTDKARYDDTVEALKVTQAAMKEYYALRGHYPCPATPDSDGEQQCRDETDGAYDPDTCTIVPAGLSCTTTSSRDGDGNGADDVVMIGVVPYAELFDRVKDTPFTSTYRRDGYNTLLTYAVTEHMTRSEDHDVENPAPPTEGAINVVDENENDVLVNANTAHFVVFSHGSNRKGGYSLSGEIAEGCTVQQLDGGGNPVFDGNGDPVMVNPPTGPSGGAYDPEIENCDNNDAIFQNGIRSTNTDGNNYNDDLLLYTATGFLPLWSKSLGCAADEGTCLYNTTLGMVGINIEPTSEFHVAGDVGVEIQVETTNYCEGNDDSTCFIADNIAGPGSTCGTGQAAYAIQNGQLECRDITWANPNSSCPAVPGVSPAPDDPRYVTAISNKGALHCRTSDYNNFCIVPPNEPTECCDEANYNSTTGTCDP